jgi:hypothetical protein
MTAGHANRTSAFHRVDDPHRQDNGQRMPQKIAAAEDGDDISRQPVEKFRHGTNPILQRTYRRLIFSSG